MRQFCFDNSNQSIPKKSWYHFQVVTESFVSILEPLPPYIHCIESTYPLISAPNAFLVVVVAGKEVIVHGDRLVVPRVLEAEENGTWRELAIVTQITNKPHCSVFLLTYHPSSLGT